MPKRGRSSINQYKNYHRPKQRRDERRQSENNGQPNCEDWSVEATATSISDVVTGPSTSNFPVAGSSTAVLHDEHKLNLARKVQDEADARDSETNFQCDHRLITDAAVTTALRTSETEVQRSIRLKRDAELKSAARASENDVQRADRLARNALAMASARDAQNEVQRADRLARNALAMASARDAQNEVQRADRLARNALATASARAAQNEVQRADRLARNALAMASARLGQTTLDRNMRLDSMLQYNANSRGISRATKSRWSLKALNYLANSNYYDHPDIQIGGMTKICSMCQAKKWTTETPSICCSNGKVQLPPFTDIPQPLRQLLTGSNAESRSFLKEIRHYNSAFQMTSFGSSYKHDGGFMPTFNVQGQVYHLIGPLTPVNNEEAIYLQVYFMSDHHQQAARRSSIAFPTGNDSVEANNRLSHILDLQNMLHEHNSYVQSFKYTLESAPLDNFSIVIDADKRPNGEHAGRYNSPTVNEVAILLSGDQSTKRDIVINSRNSGLQRICATHRSYDALQYPLLFVYGEDGYHLNIPQIGSSNSNNPTSKVVSCKQFYTFRFMIRPDFYNHLHRSQDLFNQFATDMCAKMESERLLYIKLNQKNLRSTSFIHLRDGLNNDIDPTNLGKVCILPSSFTGSPRYMHERTQDAMTIVRHYGRPDLFITFTCNPKWKEITSELFPGQTAIHRHDLIARVFHLKLHKLMDLMKLGEVFGSVLCDMYTIEWQKRGLPHAHILIWLKTTIQSNDIDKIISAEFPDPALDKDLYMKVKTHMIHGPCGPEFKRGFPCVKGNKRCSKNYPRKFFSETRTDTEGYPLYRRRRPTEGGFTARIKDNEVDNRFVVPYSPLLLSAFDAHINVEYCNSVKCIKYICKYINKGSDAASFALQKEDEINEVKQYLVGRYISSNEAFWRIFGFPIHERHPAIQHLDVHLENGQRVYFTSENVAEMVATARETTLTAFFKLCTTDEFAKTLLYPEVPSYYKWDKKQWQRRKIGQPVNDNPGIKFSNCLGRVYTVTPNQVDCFHLRMLLHEVRGPTCFEDLQTYENHIFHSYYEACRARGLLEDDSRWEATLNEIASSYSAESLRDVFVKILHFCNAGDPYSLWLKFRNQLSEDFLHQAQAEIPDIHVECNDQLYNRALINMEDKILRMGGNTLPSYGLPETHRSILDQIPTLLIQETSYDIDFLARYVADMEPRLLPDQLLAFNTITKSVFDHTGGIFFLDAPGGTGKTFVTKLILAKVRQAKLVAVAVASSGIAATLLPGGRTAHSKFKLPLNLVSAETPLCDISKESPRADLLRNCHLIVWDECTMAHKRAIEALDRSLKDIRESHQIMGGLTLLLSGDFRQILPVIPRGTRADQVSACLKSSPLWRQVRTLHLTTNMRVRLHGDDILENFSEALLSIGNGCVPSDPNDNIDISNICCLVDSLEDLKQSVFPNLADNYHNHDWICDRAILAATNSTVSAINYQLMEILPGAKKEFKSFNKNVDPKDDVKFPVEFLNSINVPGLPDPMLTLKEGCPVILLRNIAPPKLCNGTRLVINNISDNIIEATIITGCGKGEEALIPKVMLTTTSDEAPYTFKRIQFPLRLAFAMSINKSQGQTLSVAGLHLVEPCFSHGQLYVGCSRVGSRNSLFAYIPNRKTKNVVYNEVL